MSSRTSSAYNQTLTVYAQGVSQDRAAALADFIAPKVTVGTSIGQYKRYNSKNAFQVYDTARAIGGTATRIKFEADDPIYNCKPNALEIPIDDAERDAASDQMRLEESKIDTLISSALIARENKVANIVKAAVSAVSGKGVWSSDSNDPVEEIDEQIQAIATNCGMMPNAIVFGLGAWQVFRNHPKVIQRQPGAALIGITAEQASRLFLNPGIEVRVGILSKDTTKFGKEKSAENIIGAEVLIFLRSENPTQYDPSFAKTFSVGEGFVEQVRVYREENSRSDVLAIDWSEDIQVVSTECVRRIAIS